MPSFFTSGTRGSEWQPYTPKKRPAGRLPLHYPQSCSTAKRNLGAGCLVLARVGVRDLVATAATLNFPATLSPYVENACCGAGVSPRLGLLTRVTPALPKRPSGWESALVKSVWLPLNTTMEHLSCPASCGFLHRAVLGQDGGETASSPPCRLASPCYRASVLCAVAAPARSLGPISDGGLPSKPWFSDTPSAGPLAYGEGRGLRGARHSPSSHADPS